MSVSTGPTVQVDHASGMDRLTRDCHISVRIRAGEKPVASSPPTKGQLLTAYMESNH